jgi:DNA-binding transcriptional LysR family regulator
MDLNQLRCFVAAAEELHFGRAARRVEMLPSALGRFIRLLEEDLGTRLMMRTTRSVTLTDDGAAFRPRFAHADRCSRCQIPNARPKSGRHCPCWGDR